MEQALVYLLNKPNVTGRIARWIFLLHKFYLKIVHRSGTKHENIHFLSRIEKEVGVISKDDDFFNAKLMSIDSDDEPAEYKNNIRYPEV